MVNFLKLKRRGNINNLMIYMGDVAEFKFWIKLYEKKVKIKNIYNNKHQLIQIILCNIIIVYSYILSLDLYNAIW